MGDVDAAGSVGDEGRLVEDAVGLARKLLTASLADESRSERRRRRRLGTLLADDEGRQLIFALTDEVLRIESPILAARRFADVVEQHRTDAVGRLDALMLQTGGRIAPLAPHLVMPLVERRIKAETRGIVIPADDPAFSRHLARRASDGVAINVNPLGEAILSDAEADARTAAVCDRVERSDVDHVSVKVSAVVANLDVVAFASSIQRIAERLRALYRLAEAATPRTFVNLDMEEYRDLELTLQSFMTVLNEDEFAGIDAGIVLQSYLPDSHDALERLGEWATARWHRSSGTVKVRLVKGANLAMEAVEAELHGWMPAPYGSKAEVDASYKAMLESALRPAWAGALRVGLASHNLFDVAWALTFGAHLGTLDRIEFEMLEGMAPAQARAVHEAAGQLLMYAPVVAADDFEASIAYLSRRLDENTQPNNFLWSLFTLRPGSADFEAQAERFRAAVTDRHDVSHDRHRAPMVVGRGNGFANEPDSDLTDPVVRAAIAAAVAAPPSVFFEWTDDVAGIDAVMDRAVDAHRRADTDRADRRRWLLDVAAVMSEERPLAIGLMAVHTAKTVGEGDPEVSEAIDFCRYYATDGSAVLDAVEGAGTEVAARGMVVVVGPWNFPYAIPTGGVAAAIAAGNCVILKPAPEAVAVGAWIADQFWRAGVPRDVLQLVVCEDGPVGRHLVTHPDVDTVVLTGAYDTARMFLDWKPELRLLTETSGKDALIITASADLDVAIGDLVRSAFGHAGQKCSAASLAILDAPVYDDPSFRRRLADAVRSLRVGLPQDPSTMVGPLIAPAKGPLLRALTALDPGESWLIQPACLDTDAPVGTRWTPGVRLGVAPGSWFHRTECFGPVLGLMRADDLDHAIEIQNAGDYGLTGGIHSLDDAEVDRWLERVEIGNAYVNRHITGAVVRRQPFGGWKHSSIGGGAKAGGPTYVAQFARVADEDRTVDIDEVTAAYRTAWRTHYAAEHDPSGLAAESNVLRFGPIDGVAVRHDGQRPDELDLLRAAAAVTGIALVESATTDESDAQFVDRIVRVTPRPDRLRLLTAIEADARRVLHEANIAIDASPPVRHPLIELQRWVREQSISRTRHRHGRLTR